MKITPVWIKKLRERLGDTQAAFADRVGVRRATVTDWENGTKVPSRMAEILLTIIWKGIKK